MLDGKAGYYEEGTVRHPINCTRPKVLAVYCYPIHFQPFLAAPGGIEAGQRGEAFSSRKLRQEVALAASHLD
jgi:hypothetical protein